MFGNIDVLPVGLIVKVTMGYIYQFEHLLSSY